jgi:NADPH-dependent F420 reductase
MRIGIVGGTGHLGKGLAFRWSREHEIILGSRDAAKAGQTAEQINRDLMTSRFMPVVGTVNESAVTRAEIVVLSLRFDHLVSFLQRTSPLFESKIVFSPVVPLIKKEIFRYSPPPEGSAALAIRGLLPGNCRVVAGMHTVPAADLASAQVLEGDVILCGDSGEAKGSLRGLIEEIKNLRVLDGGPLQASALIESITPLILNLKQFALKKDLQIKFV